MDNVSKQIEQIEEEIRKTPYHKGTQHHIGRLKARRAMLKDKIIETQTRKGSGGSGGFAIRKHGDATVVLAGFPSVGKSTLLNALTNAKSRAADYDFTTVTVIPGMMKYKGASLQILDVPGLVESASRGRGRGREVLSVARGADLLLIMAKRGSKSEFNRINKELYLNGVRINSNPPGVAVKKTLKGGIKVTAPAMDKNLISSVAKEMGLVNADITIKQNLDLDGLIDAFSKNRVYTKALYIATMMDSAGSESVPPSRWVRYPTSESIFRISAKTGFGLDELKEAIWEKLELVRVYLKKPDKTIDYQEPIIMRQGDTLSDVLQKIGEKLAQNKRLAKIWGPGSRFPGQEASLHTKVKDQMEVMFI